MERNPRIQLQSKITYLWQASNFFRILRDWTQRLGQKQKQLYQADITNQSQNSLPWIPHAASKCFFSKCSRQPLQINQNYLPLSSLLIRLLLLSTLHRGQLPVPSRKHTLPPSFQGEWGSHARHLLFSPLPTATEPSLAAASPRSPL